MKNIVMKIKAIELINAVKAIKENLNDIKNYKVVIEIFPILRALEGVTEPIEAAARVIEKKYYKPEFIEKEDNREVYKPEIARKMNAELSELYASEVELPKIKTKLTNDKIAALPNKMYTALYVLYNYLI